MNPATFIAVLLATTMESAMPPAVGRPLPPAQQQGLQQFNFMWQQPPMQWQLSTQHQHAMMQVQYAEHEAMMRVQYAQHQVMMRVQSSTQHQAMLQGQYAQHQAMMQYQQAMIQPQLFAQYQGQYVELQAIMQGQYAELQVMMQMQYAQHQQAMTQGQLSAQQAPVAPQLSVAPHQSSHQDSQASIPLSPDDRQRLQQTERGPTLSTEDFLQAHFDLMQEPYLRDRTNGFTARFKIFMHCIQWIRAHKRLQEMEQDHLDLFLKIYCDVVCEKDIKNKDKLRTTEREAKRIQPKLKEVRKHDGQRGLDDLHWMALNSQSIDITHMVRMLFGNLQLYLFTRPQIMRIYQRTHQLGKLAFQDGQEVNQKLLHAYLDLSLFQMTLCDNGRGNEPQLVPMPKDIFHEMVNYLVKYELGYANVCHKWLDIRIRHMDSPVRDEIKTYMREHPGEIEQIYQAQIGETTSNIDDFMEPMRPSSRRLGGPMHDGGDAAERDSPSPSKGDDDEGMPRLDSGRR